MAELNKIVSLLNLNLAPERFSDASLNGLQIEGTTKIEKVALAVDGCLESVELAIQKKAQLLIVHHGLFWGSPLALTGSHQKLVKVALEAGLNLYASHLPLDAHPDLGNNFQLAKSMGFKNLSQAFEYKGQLLGCLIENSEGKRTEDIQLELAKLDGASVSTTLDFGPREPKKILVVTGSAADSLYQAENLGFDTLITGEPKQFAYHFCKERSLNAFFAGHYATETLGVKAVGKLLSEEFGVESEFLNIPTGI